jgi:hypothetical protein
MLAASDASGRRGGCGALTVAALPYGPLIDWSVSQFTERPDVEPATSHAPAKAPGAGTPGGAAG